MTLMITGLRFGRHLLPALALAALSSAWPCAAQSEAQPAQFGPPTGLVAAPASALLIHTPREASTSTPLAWLNVVGRTAPGATVRVGGELVTVQATGVFSVDGIAHGGYRAGENLSIPPLPRDTQIKVPILGRVAYETVNIVRQRPGMFRLLKLGYRVVI